MIKAKYPLSGHVGHLEISLDKPELDPKSKNNDYRCACKILGPGYEKNFYIYGIDELQCVWLSLKFIKSEITLFEEKTKTKCDYTYFIGDLDGSS